TLTRMAAAERLAAKGKVLIDAPTAAALGRAPQVAEWRVDHATDDRFAVVEKLKIEHEKLRHHFDRSSVPDSQFSTLNSQFLKPWLPPAVYDRYQAGLGDFLTELRPAVALFLRFTGIDYDDDGEAGAQLNTFIRRIQRTLTRYDG